MNQISRFAELNAKGARTDSLLRQSRMRNASKSRGDWFRMHSIELNRGTTGVSAKTRDA